jgi:predicted ATPase
MNGPGLGRVAELFFAALERAPDERSAFLDEACGGDEALRADVERLVAADSSSGALFDTPIGHVFGRGEQAERVEPEPPAPERAAPHGFRPHHLASLVGREREAGEVRELMAENRLLTLMGAAGIGKTRLALRVAEEVAADFGGRVRFVEVSAIEDPERLAAEVVRALGMDEEPNRPIADAVRAEMRRKRILLVLDGCERLAAACAPVAQAVLHSGARARVLATSREVLGVPGEAVWHVPPLGTPKTEEGSGEIRASESVHLFVERARLQKPDFDLTGRTEPVVAELCRRLDGIPLAIELAAARVRTMPVEQILAKSNEPFRLLVGGGRTASPRHRSMRAAIDWSYERLSPAEQILFRRLSLLNGVWTLEDTEGVIGAGDRGTMNDEWETWTQSPASSVHHSSFIVHRFVERLVEKSLVLVEEVSGESRYRMYSVVRAYARERLAEMEP